MRSALFATALAMVSSVAVPLAQQQGAPAPEATPAHKVYVLTGCLAARADAPSVFTLSEASATGDLPPAGAVAEKPVGTAGADAPARKPSYELQAVSGLNAQGKDEAALKGHAGQRVEVTIRPIEAVPAAPSSGARPVETAKPEEPAPIRYTVTEIKQVTGSCS